MKVSAVPRSTVIIPKVTMKELMPPQAMRAPLTAPMTAPRPIIVAIVRGALKPTFAAKLRPDNGTQRNGGTN